MAFEIETGIPVPAERGHRKYPFRQLEVGQSFFVPANGITTSLLQTRLSSGCKAVSKSTGHKFATRQVDGGVRVWRIA